MSSTALARNNEPEADALAAPSVFACVATLVTADHRLVALLLTLPIALAVVGASVFGTTIGVVGLAIVVGAARFAAQAWSLHLWPRRRSGRLAIGDAGVSLDGEIVVRRDELVAGSIAQSGPGDIRVRLLRRPGKPSIVVSVRERREGEAILDALELHPWQRTTTFRLKGRPLGAEVIIVASVLGLVGLLGLVEGLGLVSLVLAVGVVGAPVALLVTWARIQRSRVSIGHDGVLVDAFRNRSRFLTYEDILRVEGTFLVRSPERIGSLLLVLRGGPIISLSGRSEDVVPVHDALHAALDRHRSDRRLPVAASTAALIASAELARRGQGDAYRSAGLSQDQLFDLVEDPKASATDRALAAEAIATTLDDASALRLRALARRTVTPDLRRLFTRLAQTRPTGRG